MKTLNLLSILLVGAVILLAGCVQPGQPAATAGPTATATAIATQVATPTPTASAAAETASVNIQGFAFSPAALTVKKGTQVTWTNLDSVPHTVTSTSAPAGGDFDSGTLNNGQSWSKTFEVAGHYEYRCGIHRQMTATVDVE